VRASVTVPLLAARIALVGCLLACFKICLANRPGVGLRGCLAARHRLPPPCSSRHSMWRTIRPPHRSYCSVAERYVARLGVVCSQTAPNKDRKEHVRLYLSIFSPASPLGSSTNLTGQAWAEILKPAKKKFGLSSTRNAVFSFFF
jgi:hypothetical protein